MEYKWIAQDKDGFIKGFKTIEPHLVCGDWECGDSSDWDCLQASTYEEIKPLLINLETPNYKIEDGILMKVEKEQIFKAGELQYKDPYGDWRDCTRFEYRIKPKTKVVRFRNYLSPNGVIGVCIDGDFMSTENEWLGDWQEVTIEA